MCIPRWSFALLLAIAVLLPTSAKAQTYTAVSGTVLDPNGLPYSGALITFSLTAHSGQATITPCVVSPCPVHVPGTAQADATGKFTVTLLANGSMLPAGIQWTIGVTEPGVPLPWGTGPQQFTYTFTASGSSMDLSAAMSALAPALTHTIMSSGVPNPAFAIYASPFCGTNSNCLPVNDDTQIVWNSATYSAGSPDVACAGCTFVNKAAPAGDVGRIFYATNVTYPGYTSQLTSTLTCPQTTIKTVTDAHDVVLNANCSTNSVADTPIVWGDDDSSLLATAWNAAVAACTTLQLPGINAQGNGPAAMLVQQAEFNTAAGTPTRANCGLGAEAQRSGIGVHGVDISASYILPTPNFSFPTCTFGLSGEACFGSVNDGANLTDWSIWGGGYSNPSGATSNVIMDIDAQAAVTPQSGNNTLSRINIMGWGAGSSGIGIGLLLEGGVTLNGLVNVDGAGMIGVEARGPIQALTQLEAYDNWNANLAVVGTGAIVTSTGGNYGVTGAASDPCDVRVSEGTFHSIGDFIGGGLTQAVAQNGVCAGFSGAGTVYLDHTTVDIGSSNGTAVYINTTADSAYLQNSKLNGQYALYNSGKAFDLGGNVPTATTAVYTCSACVGLFGSASITGTLQTASNITPSTGWGTSGAAGNGVSAVSGDSHAEYFTVTAAGTPTANPQIAIVFPTSFWQAAHCQANEISSTGTNGFSDTIQSTLPTATGVTLTWEGTPVSGSTYTFVLMCQ